jgi:Flp pilus assembly pilin Flp
MKRIGAVDKRQSGQALIEYTLLLMMVTMVFWVGIKSNDLSRELGRAWSSVNECVELPMGCDASS